jgi:hypothetical protein
MERRLPNVAIEPERNSTTLPALEPAYEAGS